MKLAQDLRVGNVIKIGNDLFIILKFTYNKGARNASMVKLKMKNLIVGTPAENVCKAAEKFEDVVLERRKMQYLYGSDNSYTFMDQENYEQIDLNGDDLGDAVNYLQEQMPLEIMMYEGRAVGVELPVNVTAQITYTEPAVKGDSSGKVLKAAKIDTGFEMQVPLYCGIGDKIIVDTRTGEFVQRA